MAFPEWSPRRNPSTLIRRSESMTHLPRGSLQPLQSRRISATLGYLFYLGNFRLEYRDLRSQNPSVGVEANVLVCGLERRRTQPARPRFQTPESNALLDQSGTKGNAMTGSDNHEKLSRRCPIDRRDFLNGVAMTIGASLFPFEELSGQDSGPDSSAEEYFLSQGITQQDPRYYPPALTGMRGSHPGSFEAAHALRDGNHTENAVDTKERYDLVVVGGGISGLAAAYFYRKRFGSSARILVLDNHDDFGGHAKRNEFRAGNRMLLGYGGTQSIESPGKYSPEARALLVDIGIQTDRFYKAYDQELYSSMKLGTAAFFDRETFGEDRLVPGLGSTPWGEYLNKCPLSDTVRKDIARAYTATDDYLPGLTAAQKRAKLAKISYADFLTQLIKVHPDALKFFQSYTNDLFC